MDTYVTPAKDVKPEIIKLPSADQIINYRLYFDHVLCFRLDTNTESKKVFSDLVSGLSHTLVDAPFLAGRVTPDENNNGRVQIVVGSEAGVLFKFRDDKSSGAKRPIRTFEELERAHFSSSVLDSFFVAPATQGEEYKGEPVLRLDANFIDGGLLLTYGMHHSAVDACAASRFARIWAAYTKAAAEGWKSMPSRLSPDALDRSRLVMTNVSFRPEDCPEFKVVDAAASRPTLSTDAQVGTRVDMDNFEEMLALNPLEKMRKAVTTWWYFSSQSLQDLKKMAQPTDPIDPWISTGDALTALIWRRWNAARRLSEHQTQSSTFWIPIEFRSHLKLHPDYMGNATVIAPAKSPVTELYSVEPGALYRTASRIRRAIDSFDELKVRRTLALLDSMPPTALVWDIDVSGADLSLSSIAKYGWYDYDWGCTLGRITCFRPRHALTIEGFGYINPRFRDGGLEVAIECAPEDLERLRVDKAFTRFAEFRSC